MRAIIVCALLLAAVASANVVDTTDATFDEVIKGEFVLMEFYAPWCGHCKKLEPEWAKAAEQLKDVATLAKLDATVEKEAAGKYEIQGFPTIKIFREGVAAGNYEGGRTAAEIVRYVKANVGPAVRGITNAEELETLKKDSPVVAVAYLESAGGDSFEAFESAAKQLRAEFSFAVVTDSSITAADGASAGQIVVYKHFDDKKETFDGDATSTDAIVTFVKSAGVPLFDQIGPHNYKMYLDRKLPMVWVFAAETDKEALEAARESAPAFKGKLSFVWIDSTKYAGMAQRLGLQGDKFPAIAIDHEQEHFVFPDEAITKESLTAFTEKYVAGSLEATVRSEAEPASHTVEGMSTIVGSTFKALVEESDVDVFIEFYAPWCGHCKQLAPILDAVAKKLEDKPVRIAKIDATANDFPQKKFPVQGFPTMFFIPKDTHVPETYEGGRTEDALADWITSKLTA